MGKPGDGPGPPKTQWEALAFQASLGKGQRHICSLENNTEQRTKENEELTRIWDDFISKLEETTACPPRCLCDS